MKKINKCFRLLSIVAILSMTYACSEEETLSELEKTVDKYDLDKQANGNEKGSKPPGGN